MNRHFYPKGNLLDSTAMHYGCINMEGDSDSRLHLIESFLTEGSPPATLEKYKDLWEISYVYMEESKNIK